MIELLIAYNYMVDLKHIVLSAYVELYMDVWIYELDTPPIEASGTTSSTTSYI